jgi:hypothetical protein
MVVEINAITPATVPPAIAPISLWLKPLMDWLVPNIDVGLARGAFGAAEELTPLGIVDETVRLPDVHQAR